MIIIKFVLALSIYDYSLKRKIKYNISHNATTYYSFKLIDE